MRAYLELTEFSLITSRWTTKESCLSSFPEAHTVKNGVNSIHSQVAPQTGLKLPPRVYIKGVYVPSRV